MKRRYFGTDGIRGVANDKLTPELAFQLGQGAGRWLMSNEEPDRVVIGRDTRRSGPMLGAALASGFCSVGVDVVTLGIAPTPMVSFMARTREFGMGAIISASHNPAPDNGIKFVGHDGKKLADPIEAEIEQLMDAPDTERPTGAEVGKIEPGDEGSEPYLEFLEALLPERLDGFRIAVDGAHGAAYELGPTILRRLGADVVVDGGSPDGLNINQFGGATKPETIQKLTAGSRCQFGVAFDGDADRAVFCDETGALINGDRTLGIWAAHQLSRGTLRPPVVVGTIMSNGGFGAYLDSLGIALERTPVGDKYVAQRIDETKAMVGGEQSGHIIFPAHGPTGDGLVTMLELFRVFRQDGRKASEWLRAFQPWPQLLVNIEVADRATWDRSPELQQVLADSEAELSGCGRLSVRASGTQPMLRVMVEAPEYEIRDRVADKIVEALGAHAGGKVYSRVDLTHALGD